MSFKKLFLPVGLVLGAAFAIAWPAGGSVARDAGLVPWAVVVIFLINGYTMKLGDFPREWKFPVMLTWLVGVSLLGFPWVGLATGKMLGLGTAAAMGLIAISSVPPTLSSGIVVTGVAGGNVLWALVTTITLNFIGIFTLPLVIGLSLGAVTDVPISSLALLIKLAKLVLAPLLVGWGAKHLLRNRALHPILLYVPSTCVIATVWMTLSKGREDLMQLSVGEIGFFVLAALIVHALLLAVNFMGGRVLKLPTDRLKAMLFVGSQKTLPVSLTVLDAISRELTDSELSIGPAVIICVIYHFSQLIVDSILASRMSAGTAALVDC